LLIVSDAASDSNTAGPGRDDTSLGDHSPCHGHHMTTAHYSQ